MKIFCFKFKNYQPELPPSVVEPYYDLGFDTVADNAISFNVTDGQIIYIKVRAISQEGAMERMWDIRDNHLTRHGL